MTPNINPPALPEPCDPANVTSILLCGSDAATVTWAASTDAVSYTAIAQDGDSQLSSSCRSNTTSCQLSQLQCGKVYNLTVLADDGTCNSTGSSRSVLVTGRSSASNIHRKLHPFTGFSLFLSSLLPVGPEQHADLWQQLFLSLMEPSGQC